MNQLNGYYTLHGLSTCEAARDQPVGCYVNCQHECAGDNGHSKFCIAVYVLSSMTHFDVFLLTHLRRETLLKGTVSQDFSPPVFFVNLLLLVPEDMTRNNFSEYEELFNYLDASLVSLTPAKSRVLLQLDDSFQY